MWNMTTRAAVAAIASATSLCASAKAGDCMQLPQGACSQSLTVPELLATGVPRTPDSVPSASLPAEMHDGTRTGNIAPPVAVRPLDEGLSAQTSFGSWRDYNAQVQAHKAHEAKELTPKGAERAKLGVSPSAPLDLWTRVEVQGLAGDAASRMRTGLGADYKVSRSTKIGVFAEHASVSEVGTGGAPVMDKVGAYVAVQPVPRLKFEARGQLQAERSETVMRADGAQTGVVEATSLLIEPRVAKQFTLREGSAIEPFVMLRHELDPDTVEEGRSMGLAESAGVGVTISRPQSYSLSVTADVDNITAPDKAETRSKVQVTVPFR